MSKTFDEMGKEELRAACKSAGVVGYGKLNNDGMRALLVADVQARMEAKAAAEAASKPVGTTRVVQKDRPEQNGVIRPSNGTICGDIWTALDTIHASGAVPTTKDLAVLREKNGWQKHTASTQFQRWREFNALMPRRQKGE
jgi:hypothetical protein